MTDTLSTTAPVTTGLYIGGRGAVHRRTCSRSPTRQARVSSSATRRPRRRQDVADAVAAAKAAFPAWSALSAAERAAQMAAAIEGIADERDEDAAILSQENGKIRFEAWIDALVFEIRWNLALMLADEVDTGKMLPRRARHPGRDRPSPYQPLGVVTRHRAVQLADRDPRRLAPARAAGRQHRDRQAAALGAAGDHPRRAAHRREAAAGRAQRGHRQGREHGRPDPEHRRREGLLHRQRQRRQADHGDGLEDASPGSRSSWAATTPASSSRTRSSTTTHLDRLYAAIFDTTGQICMNAKRAVRAPVAAWTSSSPGCRRGSRRPSLGYGLDEGTTMGPLHSARAEGVRRGDHPGGEGCRRRRARVRRAARAASSPGGNFLRPAIVVDPDPSLRVVTQEQFGPVIPIIPFDTEDEAVAAGQRHVGAACAARSGPPTPTPPTASAGSWCAATSGSTTTAPRASTCARRSAA